MDSQEFATQALRVGLALGLAGCHTGAQVDAVLATLRPMLRSALGTPSNGGAALEVTAMALTRRAIDELLADRGVRRQLPFVVFGALRDARNALDLEMDSLATEQVAEALVSHQSIAGWLREFACDAPRLARSLRVIWKAILLPKSVRVAWLIDVARASDCEVVRDEVLKLLAGHGVDLRGVLASMPSVEVGLRVVLLRRPSADSPREDSPWRSLQAREQSVEATDALVMQACAEWPRYASHPRVLLYTLARWLGPSSMPALLARMRKWAIAPEVRDACNLAEMNTPIQVFSSAVGAGRWACGRCDAVSVVVVGHRPLDPDDLDAGREIEARCSRCSLRYWATWESESVDASAPALEGWTTLY
ncbi:MAG: hypothetical protein Q8Q09_24240 [Deltaproteobacteria bacterium]|nr:hypothetical protein [Deltaproteobacteria bacterium]